MQVELFALCEGAFNSNGRLTIVNTYDMLKSEKFPFKLPLGLALKFFFTKEDEGRKNILVEIQNEGTGTIIGNMESAIDIPSTDEVGYLNISSNVQGMVFPEPGWYKFPVKIDGNLVYTYRILVKAI